MPVSSDSIRHAGLLGAKSPRWSIKLLGSDLLAILDATGITGRPAVLVSGALPCELPLQTCLWQTKPV